MRDLVGLAVEFVWTLSKDSGKPMKSFNRGTLVLRPSDLHVIRYLWLQ